MPIACPLHCLLPCAFRRQMKQARPAGRKAFRDVLSSCCSPGGSCWLLLRNNTEPATGASCTRVIPYEEPIGACYESQIEPIGNTIEN